MIRVLWISSFVFDNSDESSSGVWQKTLFNELNTCNDLILGNIGPTQSNQFQTSVYNNCKQWALPKKKCKNGIPPRSVIDQYESIIRDFKPDVVHIWGSENFLKLLPFDERFDYKKVLVMQGVLSTMAKFIFSGLSIADSIKTFRLREMLLGGSLFWEYKSFEKEGKLEMKMLNFSDHALVQSKWTSIQVKWINQNLPQTFVTRQLRPEFLEGKSWRFPENHAVIFASCVGYSFKGLHVLIKALSLVKRKIPNVQLQLAANQPNFGFLGVGYFKFINNLINDLNLNDNIIWLGRLNAKDLLERLIYSNVFVQPSFVESYSVAFAEAMAVGTPSVISYAGAMPELGTPNVEALFFQPGDYSTCANHILNIISNPSLANELSENAKIKSKSRTEMIDLKEIHRDLYKSFQ